MKLICALIVGCMAAQSFANDRQTRVVEALSSDTAEQAVELVTTEMLELIETSTYAEEDPDQFFVEVESTLAPVIDFSRFARGVMGPHSKSASDEQRARFAESFKWSLVRTYAMALTEFKDGEVAVKPSRRKSSNPDRADVAMAITVDGKEYGVIYRMQRKAGTWRLYNLVVEGVNIGISYRTQFASAMKDPEYGGDLDRVIDAWSSVAQEVEAGD